MTWGRERKREREGGEREGGENNIKILQWKKHKTKLMSTEWEKLKYVDPTLLLNNYAHWSVSLEMKIPIHKTLPLFAIVWGQPRLISTPSHWSSTCLAASSSVTGSLAQN